MLNYIHAIFGQCETSFYVYVDFLIQHERLSIGNQLGMDSSRQKIKHNSFHFTLFSCNSIMTGLLEAQVNYEVMITLFSTNHTNRYRQVVLKACFEKCYILSLDFDFELYNVTSDGEEARWTY